MFSYVCLIKISICSTPDEIYNMALYLNPQFLICFPASLLPQIYSYTLTEKDWKTDQIHVHQIKKQHMAYDLSICNETGRMDR